MPFRGLLHTLLMTPEERIHIPLLSDGGWQRCLMSCSQIQAALQVGLDGGVLWLDCLREAQITHRVFVATVHLSGRGQSRKFGKRFTHLFRRPLEEAATPRAKKRIAAKNRPVSHECDVPQRVTRHIQYVEAQSEFRELRVLTFTKLGGLGRSGIVTWRERRYIETIAEFHDAAHVIVVLVRQQNSAECPTGATERCEDR